MAVGLALFAFKIQQIIPRHRGHLYLCLKPGPDGLAGDQIYRAAQPILKEELEVHVTI